MANEPSAAGVAMIRFLSFVIQIGFMAAMALWLADRPGTAHIVWHDTVIETSAAFLVVCILVLAFVFYLFFRLWHFLRHGPTHWRLRRKMNKMQQGQSQLTQGLIAIAAGNAPEAGRLAVAARKNLGNTVVPQWLQAQAAQLAGDDHAARDLFRALATDETASILGYRGLITEAKRSGQWDEVDRLITELHRKKPTIPWLNLIRMESAARRQQWGEAEQALTYAVNARLLDSASGRRTRAALRIALSREALVGNHHDAALQAAEQAAKQAPNWLPSILNLVTILAATGHRRAAHRAVERAWKKTPHPQLAALIRQMASTPLDAFKQTQQLCRSNEGMIESHMALAEAALMADIWGEARRFLLSCVTTGKATQEVYKMLARVERRERGDERAAGSWLMKAAEAPQDPTWLCHNCGGAHIDWQPVCGHCHSFDSLDWQTPGQSRQPLALREDTQND